MADKDFKPVVFVDKFTEGVLDPMRKWSILLKMVVTSWRTPLLVVGVPC